MERKIIVKFFQIICVVVLGLYLFQIPPFSGKNILKDILSLQPEEISSIRITPFRLVQVDFNLVKLDIEITNRHSIQKLICLMKASKKFLAGQITPEWACLLEFISKDKKVTIVVYETEKYGTVFKINDMGEWGRTLGTFQAEKMGVVIKQLVFGQKVN